MDCGCCQWEEGSTADRDDFYLYALFENQFCEACWKRWEHEIDGDCSGEGIQEFMLKFQPSDCVPVYMTGWATKPWTGEDILTPTNMTCVNRLVKGGHTHIKVAKINVICHNCGSKDHSTAMCTKPCKNPALMACFVSALYPV